MACLYLPSLLLKEEPSLPQILEDPKESWVIQCQLQSSHTIPDFQSMKPYCWTSPAFYMWFLLSSHRPIPLLRWDNWRVWHSAGTSNPYWWDVCYAFPLPSLWSVNPMQKYMGCMGRAGGKGGGVGKGHCSITSHKNSGGVLYREDPQHF